jgi:hypothetical protein
MHRAFFHDLDLLAQTLNASGDQEFIHPPESRILALSPAQTEESQSAEGFAYAA